MLEKAGGIVKTEENIILYTDKLYMKRKTKNQVLTKASTLLLNAL